MESSSDEESMKIPNNDDLEFDDCKVKSAVPTDKMKNLKLDKVSYTFWTEKDKDKLNSFR